MVDRGLLQDTARMKLDMLSAMHFMAEAWRLITPTANKDSSVNCGSLTDHVGSNEDIAVKLSEDEGDEWHSLQPLGV
jgi:hypothetical protein